jgi:predicted TIM-barrel fold metal-dependent hydrolase
MNNDTHIHIGQFENVFYNPLEVLQIVADSGITSGVYSSTTSGKEGVKYQEIRMEIELALYTFPSDIFKPYLWYIPSYMDEGITIAKAMEDLPYKGIKIHPVANDWNFKEQKNVYCLHELFAYAQDNSLPVLIHTGPNGVDAPGTFQSFFKQYKSVKFILAHCRPVDEAKIMIEKYPNVYGYTSFMDESGMRYVIKAGLADKLFTGSDFPITHYWKTYQQDNNCISLYDQYQEDIKSMQLFENMRGNYLK